MRDPQAWQASKYVTVDGGLRASRVRSEVAAGSRLITDRIAAFYTDAIPAHARGDLLDLGCGKAPLFGFYRAHCRTAYCVDWAESLHENPHLDLVQDLNDPLRLESGRYDTVILSDVLEHIRRPAALLDEIARVLRPGGTMLMNVPFLYGIHEQPYDFYRYTSFALRHLLDDAGFEVVSLEPVGGWGDVVVNLLAKRAQRVPRIGAALAVAVQRVAATLSATPGRPTQPGSRHRSELTRDLFPLGYAAVARRTAT